MPGGIQLQLFQVHFFAVAMGTGLLPGRLPALGDLLDPLPEKFPQCGGIILADSDSGGKDGVENVVNIGADFLEYSLILPPVMSESFLPAVAKGDLLLKKCFQRQIVLMVHRYLRSALTRKFCGRDFFANHGREKRNVNIFFSELIIS